MDLKPSRSIGKMLANHRQSGLGSIERNDNSKLMGAVILLLGAYPIVGPIAIQRSILLLVIALLTKYISMEYTIWNPLPRIDKTNYNRNVASLYVEVVYQISAISQVICDGDMWLSCYGVLISAPEHHSNKLAILLILSSK